MWKLAFILFMATAVLCHDKEYWDNVKDFEVVTSVDLSMSSKRSAEGVHVLTVHKQNSSMTFECIKESPFNLDSRIILRTGNSSKYLPIPMNTFKSINDNCRFRFTANKDGTIEGILFVKNEMLVFEPATKHKEYMAPHHLKKLGSGTHVILKRNALENEESRNLKRAYPAGDTLPIVPPPEDCPQTLKALKMIVVVDESLYDKRGTDGSVTYVTNDIHRVNAIYNEELNIQLVVTEMIIIKSKASHPGITWDCKKKSEILLKFSVFTHSEFSDRIPPLALLYHDCTGNGGSLGSAWRDGACESSYFTAEVTEMGDTRKRTFVTAHEIGHLLNMNHDPNDDGIMKSSVPNNNLSKWLKFSRYSQARACTKLGEATSCLSSIQDEKLFILRKRNAQGYALTTQKLPNANNHNVFLYNYNIENKNQHWVETQTSDGYAMYRKRYTTLCLDGGGGGSNLQNLKLWACDENNINQHWQRSGNLNTFRLIKRGVSYSIDGNSGGKNNQNVYLYRSSSSNQNQQWVYEPRLV